MKVAFIAHPIAGDDPHENVYRVMDIVRRINITEPDTVPLAAYCIDVLALDDNNAYERARGMKNGQYILSHFPIDELRLYGNTISNGMRAEIEIAHKRGIPVVPMTDETKMKYQLIKRNKG